MTFNPLDYPIIWSRAPWVAEAIEAQHLAIGQLLVELIQPQRIVDVGSSSGLFYMGMCHAVQTLRLNVDCTCFLSHRISKGNEKRLAEVHEDGYDFSVVKALSAESAASLTGTIDLLSLHPLPAETGGPDSVANLASPIEQWLSCLSPAGVAIFHQSNVVSLRSSWNPLIRELEESHPAFRFLHGEGVCCVLIGKRVPTGLRDFVDSFDEQQDLMRTFFEELGTRTTLESTLHDREWRTENSRVALTKALSEMETIRTERDSAAFRVAELSAALKDIENGSAWRAINHYRKGLETVLPTGSRRRSVYQAMVAMLRGSPDPPSLPVLDTSLGQMSFPRSEQPHVSVVIPTFNQPIHTFNAVRSLLKTADNVPLELIIVDDASTDQTASMLDDIEGIQIITNQKNLGFIASCNAGIRSSRGEHILLLNNDVLLVEGAVEALLGSIERNPLTGAVGAKLLYPDGRLQEAGGIIWDDGSGMNYGRLDNPDKAQYNYLREVDYCSASCLLVRRELLEKLGGLDMRYSPAYYEDADLAFSLRDLGYRVMYQPAARVVHFEGLSHGNDTARGVKRFQEVNRKKFIEKWGAELENHLPVSTDPSLAKDRLYRSVVLVADQHVPTPDRDAGSERMYNLLQLLVESGRKVVFLSADRAIRQPYTGVIQDLGVEVLGADVDLAAYIRGIAARLEVALLSRPLVCKRYISLLRRCAPRTRVIFDTVDLHHLRMKREAEMSGRRIARFQAARMRRLELKLVAMSDSVIVVSEAEKRVLRSEIKGGRISVVPTVHPAHRYDNSFAERQGLLFVGGFLHPPNVDAVKYLIREIMPAVRRDLPDVTLRIVGSDVTPEIMKLGGASVEILGWVPDLEKLLRTSRVFVAPLRFGAGLKGKVGQAFAAGLPGVMTSIAAEGFELKAIHRSVVADATGQFADAVVRLYTDGGYWSEVADAGVAMIQGMCSKEVVRNRLEAALTLAARSAKQVRQ